MDAIQRSLISAAKAIFRLNEVLIHDAHLCILLLRVSLTYDIIKSSQNLYLFLHMAAASEAHGVQQILWCLTGTAVSQGQETSDSSDFSKQTLPLARSSKSAWTSPLTT
jgi:hypothetical protein